MNCSRIDENQILVVKQFFIVFLDEDFDELKIVTASDIDDFTTDFANIQPDDFAGKKEGFLAACKVNLDLFTQSHFTSTYEKYRSQ